MTFEEVLNQAIAMLQRQGRVSYRALKRQFGLDDDYLADLKAEIIVVHQVAVDQDGTMLVWTGSARAAPSTPLPAAHGDLPEAAAAEAHYRQALALATELGMRPLVAHCHLALGTLYTRMRQAEHARPELTAAVELYRTTEMTFWLPQAEATLAQMGSVTTNPTLRPPACGRLVALLAAAVGAESVADFQATLDREHHQNATG